MANINWKEILVEVQKSLSYFEGQGIKPTLRTLFYNLVSKNIMGNTRGTYQGLSKLLVKSRKNGSVSWGALEDAVRSNYGEFNDHRFSDDIVETNKRNFEYKVTQFNPENVIKDFFDYLKRKADVDRWADQPTICEIWIEKEALANTVVQWTKDLGVTVRINKGYSSWTFLYNNAEEIKAKLERHEKLVIFYLGDLDPSGLDMDRFLKDALEFFELDESQIEFRRLGVTGEQVDLYNLPPRPDDIKTLQKLAKDPRSKNYSEKYIVELDALVAIVPDEFKELLREAVLSVFDETVYKDLKEQAKEYNEQIDELLAEAKEKAKEIMRDF